MDLLEERLMPLLGKSPDWPSFSAVLDDLGSLGDVAQTAGLDREVRRSRIIEALAESLQTLSSPLGRFQKDGVNILSLTAARGLRFPLVIVPGLDEGRFPASLREDPLLLDSERVRIGHPPRLALKLKRREEEKLLFDMAMRAAEKRLVLVTSRLDEGADRETIPSDFFLRAVSAALGRTAGYRDLNDQVPGFRSVPLDQAALGEQEIATDRTEIRLRLISRGAIQALEQGESPLLARALAFNEARWERKLTPYDGRLFDKGLVGSVARNFGTEAGPVSASRLEDYAKCPYFFLLKRVMGLESWEEQESALGMDPLERGEAIHRILEAFMRERGEHLLQTPAESLQRSLRDLAQRNLELVRPAGIHDLLWEIERDALLAMLEQWLAVEIERAKEGLFPARLEHVFGEFPGHEKAPSYRVRAGKYQFEFRGRIDRVDLSSDGTRARVLDYKVGTLPKSMSGKKGTALMGGEKMQVVVYRGAVSALPEFGAAREIRGEYLHLQPKDGKVAARAYDADRLDDAIDRLPKILELVGEGIESGVFFARTEGNVWGDGNCNFCPYESVCGKDRYQRAERKAADPAVLRLQQMAAIDGIVEEEE